ncbi:hypothetical protein GIB67_024226 [Kingdonia uniflora]|uniref:RING-type domain-containing protein n=1 Tax=Kingdonia uniflora TaxID=39325 RepID=A0A7J7LZI1_9MAGN|nr:hypothetical protein GIB67_024226 [Kingdonia uniflora]
MIGTGINLVMTIIGFAVSTMFIVFVCTRLICARIQLNASRRSFPTTSRSDLGIIERGLHGLEPVVVANFPTKKFSDECFSSSEDAQTESPPLMPFLEKPRCTVCLCEYQEKDTLRILPYCSHSFHVTCIDIWLQQHATCPVCRISLRDSTEKKRSMQPMFSSALRSPHSMNFLDSHSYHCFFTSPSYSLRSVDSQRMEPIQEDHFASDLDAVEAGESMTTLTEGNQVLKDTAIHKSKNKQIDDSPSNM